MSNCFWNHPRPVFYIPNQTEARNLVVNPPIQNDFGYFNAVAPGEIASTETIPVGYVLSRGTGISASTTTPGAVNLLAGTYEVSYTVNGDIPTGGTLSTGLELNGTAVPGTILSAEGTAGDATALSQTVVINVPQTSTLELVNNSGETATISLASLNIRRL